MANICPQSLVRCEEPQNFQIFTNLTSSISETRHRPYLKQSVSLTALGGECFQNAVESIEEIHRLFARNFPQDALEAWSPGQFEVFHTIDTANRFYTHRSIANATEIIPFSSNIDPHSLLKNRITEKYVHTTENVVEYYEKATDGERTRSALTIDLTNTSAVTYGYIGITR